MTEALRIIKMLLAVLPDSTCHHDPSWEYGWNELSDDAQDLVVAARHEAMQFLTLCPDCGEP